MFSETYFSAQFSTKMCFFYLNAAAVLETAAQRRSTARVTVRLSNEGGVHNIREAELILYPNIPPKSIDYSGKTCCWIIKPGRREKTSTCPCDRPFSGPVCLGLGRFNVYLHFGPLNRIF